MKNIFRSSLPHIGVFVVFIALILVYFYPAFEGKVLQQGDVTQFQGMVHELEEYGKPSGWTGSMFSGMPSYHISGFSSGTDFVWEFKHYILETVQSQTAGPVLILLITSYILFLVIGAPVWLSLLGAIAMAFSSYNIIIIVAGHITKAWALSFVPLIIAGLYLVFKRKYPAGLIIFTLALALEITSNHLQISYYTAILCAILFVGFFISCIKDKKFKHLGLSSGILAAGVLLAVASNFSSLYTNYESGLESMRGKAELTPLKADAGQAQSRPAEGLDKDYVFSWSYGKAETFTFLIPNLMGGASQLFNEEDSETYKVLIERSRSGQITGEEANQLFSRAREYWGDKQFTSGPVYFGAIICFLFLLAFLIVPGKSKWWLLGATVFFIFLAWGRNLAWFNDFMYYHFPLYSKFRTVEMALVIPGFIFPIMAVLALKELISGKSDRKKIEKALLWAGGITGGICFIFWIVPEMFFDFQSSFDLPNKFPDWYTECMIKDRKALLQGDALRSLVFILLAMALVFWYIRAKNRGKILKYVMIGLTVLILVDMWQVDRRYLSSGNFLKSKDTAKQSFSKTPVDEAILNDKSVSYRVLNLMNPFQEARTSYFHKSIGGYHAAKLGRYQDLIDRRITKEIGSIYSAFSTVKTLDDFDPVLSDCPTLNMLNTKYVIFDNNQPPIVNPNVYGNAWFVDSYRFVNTPDEEMTALENLNPRTEAVLDQKFAENLKGLQIIPDSLASIVMTSYAPDILEYKSSSQQDGLAILSEVYYPYGWKAYIDGQRVPISRADWVLRAVVVPAGEHQVKLVFDPDGVKACGVVTTTASALIMLMLIGGVVFYLWRKSKQ
ncbi:MAG: hypothetical protein LBJ72_11540 [Dysgonamonadaceae bacterium]|jgi:hypothetical protein|nr:hypothetical protein [Dysgonamonadaceae bacterium]